MHNFRHHIFQQKYQMNQFLFITKQIYLTGQNFTRSTGTIAWRWHGKRIQKELFIGITVVRLHLFSKIFDFRKKFVPRGFRGHQFLTLVFKRGFFLGLKISKNFFQKIRKNPFCDFALQAYFLLNFSAPLAPSAQAELVCV